MADRAVFEETTSWSSFVSAATSRNILPLLISTATSSLSHWVTRDATSTPIRVTLSESRSVKSPLTSSMPFEARALAFDDFGLRVKARILTSSFEPDSNNAVTQAQPCWPVAPSTRMVRIRFMKGLIGNGVESYTTRAPWTRGQGEKGHSHTRSTRKSPPKRGIRQEG